MYLQSVTPTTAGFCTWHPSYLLMGSLDLFSLMVLSLVAVKNYAWKREERDKFGQLRWKHKVVPPADGISPLPEFVATLKKIGFDGIYSLHSEYKGSHSFKDMDTDGCLAQTADDLEFLKGLF